MRHLLLILTAIVFLAPFAWMVAASLKTEGQAVQHPIAPPADPQWGNYSDALARMGAFDEASPMRGFARLCGNTLLIAGLTILFQIITCSFAGYAFARLRFRGRELLFVLVLATMMLPMPVTVIPQFILFQQLGWIDTFYPLIVPCLLGGNPFFIFLFRQYFLTVPRDLVEAAYLDGCGWWGIYRQVMLPLARPVLATVAVFAFLFTWNDLWTPLIYLNSPEKATLTLALAGFSRTFRISVELLMAASTVVLLPCLAVYFLTQKYFVTGVRLTAAKG